MGGEIVIEGRIKGETDVRAPVADLEGRIYLSGVCKNSRGGGDCLGGGGGFVFGQGADMLDMR
jgi:hypothetical protein